MKKLCLIIIIQFMMSLFLSAEEQTAGRDFKKNVVKSTTRVYLTGFKPIKQRNNTCSLYSTMMILNYYNYNVTRDRIKRGAAGNEFKSTDFIEKKLEKFGFEFFTSNPNSRDWFDKIIKTSINNGVPVRWSVDMAQSPIAKERKGGGGHARVITGYEYKGKTLTKIIYADTWGGWENLDKTMDAASAFHMTTVLGPVYPKDIKPEVAKELLKYKWTPPARNANPKQDGQLNRFSQRLPRSF